MQLIGQNLIFGLFVGSIYGVSAVGLALVFGVLKILNVAQGALMMLGGYLSYWLFALLGLDPFVSLLLCVPVLFAVGLLLYPLLFRRIVQLAPEAKLKNSLLVSFGLAIILQNLSQRIFSADDRAVQLGYAGLGLEVGGLVLPYTRLISFLIAVLTVVGLNLFLQRTAAGKAIRAVAADEEGAVLVGVDVRRTYLYTLALSTALAGVAGSLTVVSYSIDPAVGLSWTLKALIVVTLAGTGSVIGVFPAGLLLGLVEALSATLFGSSYAALAGLLIFLLLLVVRPRGLFGQE